MSTSTGTKNRKLHAALLIGMLLVFLLVYNRRGISEWLNPSPPEASFTPGVRRAANTWNRIHADSCLRIVRNGDLVLRSGGDAISSLFKKANTRDKTYSHAGLVFIENGVPMVYHCTGTSKDPEALLRRDSLSAFISPLDNTGYAIYRFQATGRQLEKLQDVCVRYFKEQRKFDPYFDLSTDSSLYCTEFVYKAVIEAFGDEKFFQTTRMGRFSFVSVDNLFIGRKRRLVCKIGYIQ
jgi:hypothetical protein